jgi:hypothetical protein
MECIYVVPTRGRPANAVRLVERFNATSTADARLLLILDDDDPELENYRTALDSTDLDGQRFSYRVGPRLRLGPTLNRYALEYAAHFDTVGFMGDDHVPETPGWDRILIDETKRTCGISYGNDMVHGPGLPTAVLMHSSVILALGYMVPPGLIHMYLDNFWRELGTKLNALTYRGDVVIRHVHPIVQGAPWDDGYVEANSHMGPDRERYEAYVAAGNLQEDVENVQRHQANLTS